MKCKVCNGNLKCTDGVFVCENCGSKQQLSSLFQNYDVFLAYIENDENGRRTKDSIISQEIYHNLQELNIKVFNERISLDNVPLTQYEEALEIAFKTSRIIVVVGTTVERLNSILSKYQIDKAQTIIPVVSQMKLNELPKQVLSLQAINYDNIGAVSDIKNNISNLLDLNTEYDVIASAKKNNTKKRKYTIISVISFVIIAIALSIYYIFGTPYVLDSKKYEFGQKLLDDGNYIEAINQFSKISEYKDSKEKIDSIYDKYNGYFSTDSCPITLYLNIDNNKNAKIEVIKNANNNVTTIEAENKINGDIIEFSYKDDQNNRGTGIVTLLNEGLKLVVNSENDDTKPSLESLEQIYEFSDRSDAPQEKVVTISDLVGWMNKKTNIDNIRKQGVTLDYIADLNPVDTPANVYKISNTNYGLMFTMNEKNEEFVVGIYAPHNDLFPNESFSYIPFTLEDAAFIPFKVYIGGATNLIYELATVENDFEETTLFVTTKEATTGNWDEIIKSIQEIYEYNNSEGTEYYLKSTTSGSIIYTNLDEAIEASNHFGYILVDKYNKVVYRPF